MNSEVFQLTEEQLNICSNVIKLIETDPLSISTIVKIKAETSNTKKIEEFNALISVFLEDELSKVDKKVVSSRLKDDDEYTNGVVNSLIYDAMYDTIFEKFETELNIDYDKLISLLDETTITKHVEVIKEKVFLKINKPTLTFKALNTEILSQLINEISPSYTINIDKLIEDALKFELPTATAKDIEDVILAINNKIVDTIYSDYCYINIEAFQDVVNKAISVFVGRESREFSNILPKELNKANNSINDDCYNKISALGISDFSTLHALVTAVPLTYDVVSKVFSKQIDDVIAASSTPITKDDVIFALIGRFNYEEYTHHLDDFIVNEIFSNTSQISFENFASILRDHRQEHSLTYPDMASIYIELVEKYTVAEIYPSKYKFKVTTFVNSKKPETGTKWEYYYYVFVEKISKNSAQDIGNFLDYNIFNPKQNRLPDFSSTTTLVENLPTNPKGQLGLVTGEVQSGKTAFFIAAVSKAIDYGYNYIIVLTSSDDKLQTQTYDRILNDLFDPTKTSFPHFSKPKGSKFKSDYSYTSEPKIFVMKKQVDVLASFNSELPSNIADFKKHKSSNPNDKIARVFVIDDEADHTSINTKDDTGKADPITVTTSNIIDMLSCFDYFHYMAVTASPFSNLMISRNPGKTKKSFTLYPKDYVIDLNTPIAYLGLNKINKELLPHSHVYKQGSNNQQIIDIGDDLYNSTKQGVKGVRELEFKDLMPQIKEALYSFYIISAIRDLRGQENHRTMLINVHTEKTPHKELYIKLEKLHNEIKAEITDPSSSSTSTTPTIPKIKEVFENTNPKMHSKGSKPMGHCLENIATKDGWTWDIVFNKIKERIGEIDLYISNSDTNKPTRKNLAGADVLVKNAKGVMVPASCDFSQVDFDKKDALEKPIYTRAIVIGGQSLSRGLTLEELCVSVLHRTTFTCDILLQMARWFGYRKGYDDLFRIWLNKSASEYFTEVADLINDMKNHINIMNILEITPREYDLSLKVEAPPKHVVKGARTHTTKGKKKKSDKKKKKVTDGDKSQHGTKEDGRLKNRSKSNKNFWGTINEFNYYDYSKFESCINENIDIIDNFITKYSHSPQNFIAHSQSDNPFIIKTSPDTIFVKDISIDDITKLLEDFNVHKDYNLDFKPELLKFLKDKSNKCDLSKWDIAFVNNALKTKESSNIYEFSKSKINLEPFKKQSLDININTNSKNTKTYYHSFRLTYAEARRTYACLGLQKGDKLKTDPNFRIPGGISDFEEFYTHYFKSNQSNGDEKPHYLKDSIWFEKLSHVHRKPLLLISLALVNAKEKTIISECKISDTNVLKRVPVITICIPNKNN